MSEQAHPRAAAFDRFSRMVEGPMLVLTIIMIPVLVTPFIWDLSPAADRTLVAIDWFIWAAFAFEYGVKLSLSPDRRGYFRTHIPDLLLVVVPFLRPLRLVRSVRLLRLLRLGRLVLVLGKTLRTAREILRRRGLSYVLMVVGAVVLASSVAVMQFERANPEANIHNFPDALWWALTTVTTVGYGDHFPMTAGGRGVAVLLMVLGITLFGVLTAAISSYFVEKDVEERVDAEVTKKLDLILARLDALDRKQDLVSSGRPEA